VTLPRTRRAVIAGAIGGTVAVAASAIGRVDPVLAGSDGDVVLGGVNAESSSTRIGNLTGTTSALDLYCASGDALVAKSAGAQKSGVYALGTGATGYGVYAVGGAAGLHGSSSSGSGVHGSSTSGSGVHGSSSSANGVVGYGPVGAGVYGSSDSGFGVQGWSGSSIGVSGAAGVSGSTNECYGVRGSTNSTGGFGVFGASYAGSGNRAGVCGYSNSLTGSGVLGRGAATGVYGYSGEYGTQPAAPAKTGVCGYAVQDGGAMGVYGKSTAGRGVQGVATTGFGVRAAATTGTGTYSTATTGTAVYAAVTASGYALRTSGRVKVEKASGVATIAAGNTSVLVTPGLDVTTTSFVLLTPRADIGTRRLWYTTDATANTITIRVSSAVTTSLAVGWLLLG
jgi:hypothetical protein